MLVTAMVGCLKAFFLFDSLRSINNLSVKQGPIFLGWTSTKLGLMCLAQGPQRNDAGEARTRDLSVLSQALYHWATALPSKGVKTSQRCEWLIVTSRNVSSKINVKPSKVQIPIYFLIIWIFWSNKHEFTRHMMTFLKITKSQNGQIYPEDTFSHGAAHIIFHALSEKSIWSESLLFSMHYPKNPSDQNRYYFPCIIRIIHLIRIATIFHALSEESIWSESLLFSMHYPKNPSDQNRYYFPCIIRRIHLIRIAIYTIFHALS